MEPRETITTVSFYPHGDPRRRLFALWYFTTLMIVWNVLGHTLLGFEQSPAAPAVAVATSLLVQALLEWVDARTKGRAPRFTGGLGALADSLPPPIISGFACAMLLYANDRLWPIVFACTVSIGSKVIFRAPVGNGRTQHFFNPSNLGVAATLLLFPWVGFAPPYHFTRNLFGYWHWVVPAVVLLSGIIIHSQFTGRLPLCLAWVGGFVAQGLLRSWAFGNPWFTPLVPMTSAAFIIFTLYMIPDPATTPLRPLQQAMFGLGVAVTYGVLQVLHVVFGLFIALAAVSAFRGLGLYVLAAAEALRVLAPAGAPNKTGATAD